MNDRSKIFLYALIIPAIFLLAGILACTIDYAINKAIIDAIPASAVQWYNFFTFNHYMTWLFINQSATFWGIYIACTIGLYAAAFVVLYYALR